MPDIELLGLLETTCEVARDQQVDRKFDSRQYNYHRALAAKENTRQQTETEKADEVDANSNKADHFRSRINRSTEPW